MKSRDAFNLYLAQSQEEVGNINKIFYNKFNYPWPPMTFDAFSD